MYGSVIDNEIYAKLSAIAADLHIRDYVVPPETLEVADDVVFYLVAKDKKRPVCCGFFYSKNLGMTVKHNVAEECFDNGFVHGKSLRGTDFTFCVEHSNDHLDFLLLSLAPPSAREHPEYYKVTTESNPRVFIGQVRVGLLGCGIALADETTENKETLLPIGLTVQSAAIIAAQNRHLAYNAPTFDGDSGACLFMSGKGEVIGMHLMGINRAREEVEQERQLLTIDENLEYESAEEGLGSRKRHAKVALTEMAEVKLEVDSVRKSLSAIIHGIKTGGIALFLGAREVREAIRTVNEKYGLYSIQHEMNK